MGYIRRNDNASPTTNNETLSFVGIACHLFFIHTLTQAVLSTDTSQHKLYATKMFTAHSTVKNKYIYKSNLTTHILSHTPQEGISGRGSFIIL